MKATDLMIGDWVKCKDPKCEGHQVDLIDLFNEEVGLDGEIDNFENIIPIPLTPEILEKNGWKITGCKDAKYYFHGDIPFCIPLYGLNKNKGRDVSLTKMYADDFFDSIMMRIHYVHELQHAFKFFGVEKEIEL